MSGTSLVVTDPPVPTGGRAGAPHIRPMIDPRDWADELPILYEDEGQEHMGDSRPHGVAEAVVRFALMAHFAARPGYEVLPNMNLYYHRRDRWAYVSPDVMVVTPPAPLPAGLRSYRIGEAGPAPVLAVEVLSRRTFQQGDLTLKPVVYAGLGVQEYLLVDSTGEFLPERLLLKAAAGDGTWIDSRDQGEGVVSRAFGFGVRVEPDGGVRVYDVATGRRYARPDEADAAARAAAAAEARVRELEAELARLRGRVPPTND